MWRTKRCSEAALKLSRREVRPKGPRWGRVLGSSQPWAALKLASSWRDVREVAYWRGMYEGDWGICAMVLGCDRDTYLLPQVPRNAHIHDIRAEKGEVKQSDMHLAWNPKYPNLYQSRNPTLPVQALSVFNLVSNDMCLLHSFHELSIQSCGI
jgi:hypothetical protein